MTDISVPCWNDVDIEELCNGVRLIAFDLDNTLARYEKANEGRHGRMLLRIDIVD